MTKQALIDETLRVLDEWYGIVLSQDHVLLIFEKEPAWYADSKEYGIDTVSREELIDSVLKYVLNINASWPLFGSSKEYKKNFYKQLHTKAAEVGVKINLTQADFD